MYRAVVEEDWNVKVNYIEFRNQWWQYCNDMGAFMYTLNVAAAYRGSALTQQDTTWRNMRWKRQILVNCQLKLQLGEETANCWKRKNTVIQRRNTEYNIIVSVSGTCKVLVYRRDHANIIHLTAELLTPTQINLHLHLRKSVAIHAYMLLCYSQCLQVHLFIENHVSNRYCLPTKKCNSTLFHKQKYGNTTDSSTWCNQLPS